jgi:FlaA1/EpsC-like NDP-sugar epimerase
VNRTSGTRFLEGIRSSFGVTLLNGTVVGQAVLGKVILVTGAGGSIGSALARALGSFRPRHLILLDDSERNLNQVVTQLASSIDSRQFSAVLGNVCDEERMLEIFGRYRPEVVYHAAAFKHVPLMEINPLAAVANNALATYNLAKLSRKKGVSSLILISTDKAVNPISIMGASKRVAEVALAALGNSKTRMSVIRLGNVLGTEGSVVPLFLSQISQGGPVTVTHRDATRYFLSLDEAVDLILEASATRTGELFIPRVIDPVNIWEMALEMIKKSNSENQRVIEISITGLRPGDKLSEEFLYPAETAATTDHPQLLRVLSAERSSGEFELNMRRLASAVEARDIASSLDAICHLVPEYRPTETVIRLSQGLPA